MSCRASLTCSALMHLARTGDDCCPVLLRQNNYLLGVLVDTEWFVAWGAHMSRVGAPQFSGPIEPGDLWQLLASREWEGPLCAAGKTETGVKGKGAWHRRCQQKAWQPERSNAASPAAQRS